MITQVDQKKDYEEYLEAVDVVCMGCAYGEDTCNNCPVRKTVKNYQLEEK